MYLHPSSNRLFVRVFLTFTIVFLFIGTALAQQTSREDGLFRGWRTDTSERSIDLSEIISGGPPRDGIPPIDIPKYIPIERAREWLAPQEPVIVLSLGGDTRAYPIQILTWHEIVNGDVGGIPVVITFCSLCNSSIAYGRTLDGVEYTFGGSGMLHQSNVLLYDRQTQSLWRQFTGEAIVGALTGSRLVLYPVQILSFAQFEEAYPTGLVLSRDTGFEKDYGVNPHVRYDDILKRPYLFSGPYDYRIPPMERVIAVSIGGEDKAYPFHITWDRHVIQDVVGGQPIVVFHAGGAVSPLDQARISRSREIGSAGVFSPFLEGDMLRFRYKDGRFVDVETGSSWNITGTALSGPLVGRQLRPIPHGVYFYFAWYVFNPETILYDGE